LGKQIGATGGVEGNVMLNLEVLEKKGIGIKNYKEKQGKT